MARMKTKHWTLQYIQSDLRFSLSRRTIHTNEVTKLRRDGFGNVQMLQYLRLREYIPMHGTSTKNRKIIITTLVSPCVLSMLDHEYESGGHHISRLYAYPTGLGGYFMVAAEVLHLPTRTGANFRRVHLDTPLTILSLLHT